MNHINEEIKELATKVFSNTDKADAWLTTPIKSLNDQTPISKLENAEGIKEVRALLRKIESGEFT